MKQVIIIFFVLLLIIIGLEVNNIIPSIILPSLIAIHDSIKANPYILVFITNIKSFITNFEIKPYLDALDATLISIYDYVKSLPWEKINIWYILGIIFVIGVLSEKFRTLSNEMKLINQKLSKIKREIVSDNNDINADSKVNITDNLHEDALNIINLLTDIKKTTDNLKSTELRSKKLRREVALMGTPNDSETSTIIDQQSEPVDSTIIQERDYEEQPLSDSPSRSESDENDELDISTDDISHLDLARTYIEADEIDKAENIIKKVVQTGTEHEKHEAKLLFMQLRK